MYNADFIPSVALFRRLKVLMVTGLPMRENLRVYFSDHYQEYEKFGWNAGTLKMSNKDAFEERRRGLLAEWRAPEKRQFGLDERTISGEFFTVG